MYFKCVLENNEIIYKDFTDKELLEIIDQDLIVDELSDLIEDKVDYWNFTDYPTSYSNIFLVDLKKFIIQKEPNFSINEILVKEIKFLENEYEVSIASFSLDNPQPWEYSKKIEAFPETPNYKDYEAEYYAEDPYGDDGPGY